MDTEPCVLPNPLPVTVMSLPALRKVIKLARLINFLFQGKVMKFFASFNESHILYVKKKQKKRLYRFML